MRLLSQGFIALAILLHLADAVAADAKFGGPALVIYTVGHSYGLNDSNSTAYDGSNTAFYSLGWVDGASVSDVTVSGQLPTGLSLQIAPFPIQMNSTLEALLGAPAVGTDGVYKVALNATVNGVVYTYPVTLVVESQTAQLSTLPGGITGNWYGGPSESGQGFSIEVLPNSIMLAQWYVFTPSGGQAWIVGTGTITGNSAAIQGYQVTGPGALFPPAFDSSNVQPQPWGTLTFTFYDCNYGHVVWNTQAKDSAGSSYIDGGMALQRLTQPAGLTCP